MSSLSLIHICKIVVSCLPAIVFVVLGLDETCDRLFYNPVCVAVALIVFGVAFILVENHNAAKQARVEQMRDITFQMAILIGLFQLLDVYKRQVLPVFGGGRSHGTD